MLYRSTMPETATSDFEWLFAMVRQYGVPNGTYPVFDGEWGYTSATPPCN